MIPRLSVSHFVLGMVSGADKSIVFHPSVISPPIMMGS